MAIPFIINIDEDSKEHDSLIAQAKNGAGKSGAFIIGSLLRIDPSIKKTQVIIIGHTRELVNQLASVVARIIEYAPSYKMCNTAVDKPDGSAHIIISTLGSILNQFSGRSKNLDLSELRVFVLDEADAFFLESTRKEEIMKFHKILQGLGRPIQHVFFSATYDADVSKEISNILDEAIQISLQIESVKLDNIQQFYYKCKPKGKIDFVKEIYDAFSKNT
jgi:superfamily II DNA/RNA helicase